jgi:hypothetical protein
MVIEFLYLTLLIAFIAAIFSLIFLKNGKEGQIASASPSNTL